MDVVPESRGAREQRQVWITGLLAGLIAITLLMLVNSLRVRIDLTADGDYTLAPATVALLDRLEDRLEVRLYVNQDLEGAEAALPSRMAIEDLLAEIEAAAGGRMTLESVDPTVDAAANAEAEVLGITPIPITGQGRASVSVTQLFQGMLMRYGGQDKVIPIVVPAQLELIFASNLADLLRTKVPVIGFFSREPAAPPTVPGGPVIPQPPARIFSDLRDVVDARYEWRDVALDVPGDLEGLDALFVLQPDAITPTELDGLQQFLASGGHAVICLDYEAVDDPFSPGLQRADLEPGCDEWLESLGLHVRPQIVFDERGTPTNVPVRHDLGGGRTQSASQRVANGLWPLLQGPESLAPQHVLGTNQAFVVMMWAHPVHLTEPPAGMRSEWLLRSSAKSWLLPAEVGLAGTYENLDALGRRALQSGPARTYDLAAILSGPFAPDAAREGVLVVIGDSDFVRNGVLQGENRDFAASLADWLVQDESLIGVRGRGRDLRQTRDFYIEYVEREQLAGKTLTEDEARDLDRRAAAHQRSRERLIAWANVLIPPVGLLLLALGHFAYHRRRWRRPFRSPQVGA